VIKLLARCAGAFALLTLLSPAWAFAQEPAAAPKNPAAVPTAEQITRILGQISEITGLKLKHPVPMSTLTKAEWRRWVDDRVRESAKPEEIRVEETAMKMFGFFPPEFDLRASTVDLMSEQAAAVYDHKKKRMIFVQDAAPEDMEEAVLAHELSHALADQHFDMGRFLEKGPRSDESDSARLAVVEGQAMWIMLEVMMNRNGQSLTTNSAALQLMLPSMGKMAASQYPVFDKSPLYLKESLLFPYSAGLLFQQAVIDKLGREAFAAVLRDPPKNTQQILHPEKYLAHEAVASVDLPELDGRSKMKKLTDGDVGEFDMHVLFEQYSSKKDADEAAPAWRAGRFELLEEKGTKHPVLRWAVLWATPESAQQALSLYLKVMEKKSQNLKWTRQAAGAAEGSNQHGAFRIWADGSRLEAIEGLP
jgi:hypothetical protein